MFQSSLHSEGQGTPCSRGTPCTPREAKFSLVRDETPDRHSEAGAESSCSAELPVDVARLWLRVKQAETGEAQAVQELTARMDAQVEPLCLAV
jgi:hypothetical protein